MSEELKRKAVERFQKLMKEEYEKGYEEALQLIDRGGRELLILRVLVDKTEEYIRGFRDAVQEVFSEAKTPS